MGETVGIIGLGLVGSALAERLLSHGFEVVGFDVDPARNEGLIALGGYAVSGVTDVARECRRIVLSLMTSQIVQEVVEGPRGLMESGCLPSHIIDTTTGDPDRTIALSERLRERGISYLDATVNGSSRQVREGKAVFMVGGSPRGYESCRDLFAAFSEKTIHLGPCGAGSKAKLAANLILGLNRAVLAEGLVFAEALGLDLNSFLDLLRISPAYSAAVDVKGSKMISGDFTPDARLSQHLKDLELIFENAAKSGQDLPLARTHSDLLRSAIGAGDGDLDNSAIIREIRRRRDH
jgi:3-hydroxyisobutyrate dehydrogenase-like beta-hydroxyacid dehydrogenase